MRWLAIMVVLPFLRRKGAKKERRKEGKPVNLLCFFASLLLCSFPFGYQATALAGLYNPAEPEEGTLHPDFLRRFLPTLTILRTIPMDKVPREAPLRKRYRLMAANPPAVVPPTLSVEQKLSLSAYLIRSRKLIEARQVLEPLAASRPENFLVYANLGTMYQLLEEWGRARDYLEQGLQMWPKQWSEVSPGQKLFLQQNGWDEDAFAAYRQAETYHLKLVRLRSREAITAKTKDVTGQNVDALFDDGGSSAKPLRFVGESGQFEPGKLAEAEKAKLPKDALQIVQQLLVWLPEDARLYWLLGELYNAQGDVAAARYIFNDLVDARQQRFRDLLDHRQALSQYRDKAGPGDDPNQLLVPTTGSKKKDKPGDEETGPTINWRSLGVGFLAGLIVAFFAYWQLREIARRRAASKRHSPNG